MNKKTVWVCLRANIDIGLKIFSLLFWFCKKKTIMIIGGGGGYAFIISFNIKFYEVKRITVNIVHNILTSFSLK